MEILSYNLLSKLLSSKNTQVISCKTAKTASISLDSNTITIPNYMIRNSDNTTRFAIAHESSHAMHTPKDGWLAISKESRVLMHVVNVIEDVRIDDLIMQKYPGIVYDYKIGIKNLHDNTDFFGDRKEYVSIVDKLNYHLKVNKSGKTDTNIDLLYSDPKLLDYYKRSIACTTFDEVVLLARELIENENVTEKDLNISSVISFDNLENALDLLDEYVKQLGSNKNIKSIQDTVIPICKEDIKPQDYYDTGKNGYNNFIEKDFVIKMVHSFRNLRNRRNIAAQKTKMGDICMDSVHAYKYSDKIFEIKNYKRKMQNHGIVMLIDASGSMSNLANTVRMQLGNITEFCNICNIPFEIYYYKSTSAKNNKSIVKLKDFSGALIQSGPKTGTSKFKQINSIRKYKPTDSTPTTSALWGTHKLIKSFKNKYKIDKTIFILLTDGADDDSIESDIMSFPEVGGVYRTAPFFTDKLDDKNHYMYTTNAFLSLYKNTLGTTNIVFYIGMGDSKKSELNPLYNESIDYYANLTNMDMSDKEIFIKEFIRIIA